MTTTENISNNRGGKRAGAGRKKTPKHLERVIIRSIRLPRWLAEWLQDHGQAGKTIEAALIETHNLTVPHR